MTLLWALEICFCSVVTCSAFAKENGSTKPGARERSIIKSQFISEAVLTLKSQEEMLLNTFLLYQRPDLKHMAQLFYVNIVKIVVGIFSNAAYQYILEKLERNDRMAGNILDISITSRRKQNEKKRVLELRTV